LALVGCQPLRESNVRIIPFHQIGDPVITFDPTTGTRVRTTQWQYEDGYETETVERISITGANEFRRNPGPAIRTTDP
jgi:hypothetical protein